MNTSYSHLVGLVALLVKNPIANAGDIRDMGLGGLWELVMNREAWRAAVHGVTKSRTRLSD